MWWTRVFRYADAKYEMWLLQASPLRSAHRRCHGGWGVDWQVQETLPRYVYFDMIRGVFKTLSNIYDEAFCENSERLTNIS